MNTSANGRRLGALGISAALAFAACGSDEPAADEPAADAPADDAMDDEMAMDDDKRDMDMSAMNMGDAGATPASEVEGAALASGGFTLLDTRPAGYNDVTGTAVIARSDAGTTVTTELSGLLPNTAYISHVHEQACADDNAGDHFQFVDGDVEVPPNEIHLAFTSDADGNGFMTAENDAVATADAVAFVVHPAEFIDNKVACADFVADDPDAVAAAIESGPAFDESLIQG